MPISPSQTQAFPLFILPGLIDEDENFDNVWEAIQETMPVSRVSYLDWTDLVGAAADVPTLVAYIKRQIEAELPSGPLRIAGYSIGGCLAYLVALAFQSEGRLDVRVAIMDATGSIDPVDPSSGKRIREMLSNLLRLRIGDVLASVLAKGLTKGRMRALLRRCARFRQARLPFRFDKYLHPKLTMQMELQIFRPWWRRLALSAPRLAAPTFIFRSEDYDGVAVEDLGWAEYCSDYTVIRVAGDHGTMLHPEINGPLLRSLMHLMTQDSGTKVATKG